MHINAVMAAFVYAVILSEFQCRAVNMAKVLNISESMLE